MARLTISQLTSELEAARVENQRLTALNEGMVQDIAAYVERLNKAKEAYRALRDKPRATSATGWRQRTVAPREETDEHKAYVAKLAKAKAKAEASGKTVLV